MARPAEGRDPEPVRATCCGSTGSTAPRGARRSCGRSSAGASSRAMPVDDRGRAGRATCSTASARGGSSSAPAASGTSGRERPRAGIEAPYLQLVMQRLWEVERASGSTTLRAATLAGARRRRTGRRRPPRAGDRGADARRSETSRPALRPPRHAVGDEDRARGVRPRAVRRACPEDDVRGVLGVARRAPHPAHGRGGRWEIFHDVLAGAVLGWKSRYDAERAVERARAPTRVAGTGGSRFSPSARSSASLAMTALAVFAFSQRSEARDQARVARTRRSSSRARCRCSTATPSSGSTLALEARARSTPTASGRGRPAAGARRVARAGRLRHRSPVVGLEVDRSARPRVLVVGDDGSRPLTGLGTGDEVWSHRVDGCGGRVRIDGRPVGRR